MTQGSKPWSFGRNLGQQRVSNFGEQNDRVETDTPPEILVHWGGRWSHESAFGTYPQVMLMPLVCGPNFERYLSTRTSGRIEITV